MAFLYNRKENHKEIIIEYSYQAAYYISLIVVLIISSIPYLGILFIPLLFLIMAIQIIGKWQPNKEIRQAMRQGKKVHISGNRFSFKNPITFTIEK